MLDLILAVAHHILIFAIFGILLAEFLAVRPGMNAAAAAHIAAVDRWYGILAAAVIAVGFCRAIYAAKGWVYYSHNGFFWAKICTFALIGVLSVPPTLAYLRWRKLTDGPDEAAVRAMRGYLHLQLLLFVLLPIFAAAMARGYGEFI